MRRILALALLLIGAAPAAASERAIAPGPAFNVTAHSGYMAWDGGSDSSRELWHDGTVTPLRVGEAYWGVALGSDAARRPAATFTNCDPGPANCVVRQRLLRSGQERVLYRDGGGGMAPAAAMHRGTLAIAAGGGGRPVWLSVRRPGDRRLRRIATIQAPGLFLSVGAGHVAYRTTGDGTELLRVEDLASGRNRAFAVDDTYDSDCRCGVPIATARNPLLAGRYLHWLEERFTTAGYRTTRIARAPVDAAAPRIEYYATEQPAQSYALRGSRIVYTAEPGGVVEVRDPAWQRSGERIPART